MIESDSESSNENRSDFFERDRIASSFEGYGYNPETLLVRSPWPYHREQSLATRSANCHECFHWAQHHGTVAGTLTSLLKQLRETYCILFLQDLPKPILTDLANSRRLPGGHPLFTLNHHQARGGVVLSSFAADNVSVHHFASQWCGAHFGQKLLSRASVLSPLMPNQDSLLGDSITTVVNLLLNGPEPEDFWIPPPAPLRLTIPVSPSQSREFTTHSIIESAATVDESLYIMASRDDAEVGICDRDGRKISRKDFFWPFQVDRLNSLMQTDYGIALRAFQILANDVWEADPFQLLPAFLAVCDLALNPPLPPVTLPKRGQARDWSDLYPPSRFVKLAAVVPKIRFPADPTDNKCLQDYMSSLADASGLPDPKTYDVPPWTFGGSRDFSKIFRSKPTGEETSELTGIQYWEFVAWVHKEMWKARGDFLPLFVCPGLDFWAHCNMTDLRNRLLDTFWYRPPVVLHHEGLSLYPELGKEYGFWLLFSTAFHYGLYDFVTKAGLPDFAAYFGLFDPSSTNPLWKQLSQAYRDTFGIDIW